MDEIVAYKSHRFPTAGWRIANTAMRLVIIAATAGAFYALIGGFLSEFALP
jgi:hypothetical protein